MINREDTTSVSAETNWSSIGSVVSTPASSVTMNESRILELVFSVCLNSVICVLGTTANIINIIIFFKQGFTEAINISFCGLAISDLGALLSLLWRSISLNPLFESSNIDFDIAQMEFLTAGWPHGVYSWITCWITAFITFERCICIALPLKVRDIVTPKRTFTIIVLMYICITSCIIPVFFAFSLTPVFNAQRNRTLYTFTYAINGVYYETICFNINIFEQLSSFFFVIVCTTILISNLLSLSQWRRKATAISSSNNSVSVRSRDMRVVKMVTSVSCVFIVCYLPGTINLMVTILFSDEYRFNGRYQTAFHTSWTITVFLETINSSINILVYYNMSSKFRSTFKDMFRLPLVEKANM